MTRPTWLGMEQSESTPKDFEELTADCQRNHFHRLWEALDGVRGRHRHMKTTWTAWTIKARLWNENIPPTDGFIGRYWWFQGKDTAPPAQFHGCRNVMFRTRQVARQYRQLSGIPEAKVVKVRVTMEEA